MRRAALIIIVSVALFPPTSAFAQRTSEWEAQVRQQLINAGSKLYGRGFELTHETYTGSLYNNTYETLTLTLHAGTGYALVGVCDADCSDLDLVLYDADGREVSSDLKPDDTPVVIAVPNETQR